MGWKNVKEHYRIGHIVQVTEKGICIGSGYIHVIIVISLDGRVLKRYDDLSNEDLRRYQHEIDADHALLKRLIATPDVFTSSLTVYTYDGGDIIEKQCEVLGWPNVTHDGEMMYENEFSDDKETVITWAKRNVDSRIKYREESAEEAKRRLADCYAHLEREKANWEKLLAAYPAESSNVEVSR